MRWRITPSTVGESRTQRSKCGHTALLTTQTNTKYKMRTTTKRIPIILFKKSPQIIPIDSYVNKCCFVFMSHHLAASSSVAAGAAAAASAGFSSPPSAAAAAGLSSAGAAAAASSAGADSPFSFGFSASASSFFSSSFFSSSPFSFFSSSFLASSPASFLASLSAFLSFLGSSLGACSFFQYYIDNKGQNVVKNVEMFQWKPHPLEWTILPSL